jgi:predicted aminopeptidase
MVRSFLCLLFAVLLAGCDTVAYYKQAIGGHMGIMSAARPVDEWLADPATPQALRERLVLARGIREFASRELRLPDNASYTSYADLGRPFVVWNVFAAPEFSVSARKECFPFTGCVSYRGFFSEGDARAHAARLKHLGLDVHVGGVPAYSTLGWFNDPLLSTFIRYPDAQLARLVFHELAHQVVYSRDDTTFNESFAVAVEEEGVRRWLEATGRKAQLDAFRAAQGRRQVFVRKVKETRDRLDGVYKQKDLAQEAMMARKREEFARLRSEYPGIVPEEPNNAFLASIGLYTELVPAFEQILRESGSLPVFYERVKELAKSGKKLKPPGPVSAADPGRLADLSGGPAQIHR